MNEIFKGMDNAAEVIDGNFKQIKNNIATVLWEGKTSTNGEEIVLSENMMNFEMLMVVGSASVGNHQGVSNILTVSEIPSYASRSYVADASREFIIPLNSTEEVRFSFISENTVIIRETPSASSGLTQIVGLFRK